MKEVFTYIGNVGNNPYFLEFLCLLKTRWFINTRILKKKKRVISYEEVRVQYIYISLQRYKIMYLFIDTLSCIIYLLTLNMACRSVNVIAPGITLVRSAADSPGGPGGPGGPAGPWGPGGPTKGKNKIVFEWEGRTRRIKQLSEDKLINYCLKKKVKVKP